MKKIVYISIVLLVLSLLIGATEIYAKDDHGLQSMMDSMKDSSKIDSNPSNITNSINDVIGLMQLAGNGIALVIVTILGIKYMIASPSEKADVKKSIFPILIGCVLLFGAVNLVAIMADMSEVFSK